MVPEWEKDKSYYLPTKKGGGARGYDQIWGKGIDLEIGV